MGITLANGGGGATAPGSVLKQTYRRQGAADKEIVVNCVVPADVWTAESAKAWSDAQDSATHAVELSHPLGAYALLMFPDASDEF